MDVFLEYLMRKKPTGSDAIKKLALVLAAILACLAVLIGFPMLGSFMNGYVLLGVAAVVYGLVVLLRNFSIEYEYIFTNGVLDIDVIKAQKTRSRLISLQCRSIERMAPAQDERYQRDFESEAISKRYNAVFDLEKGGVYHVLFICDGERLLLTFQPPRKLLAAMKKMNPRCVELAPEDQEPETAED